MTEWSVPGALFVRRGFLDERLRSLILTESNGTSESAGAIFRGHGTLVDPDYRRCQVVASTAEIDAQIASRFEGMVKELAAHFDLELQTFQKPRLLRYAKGDFFVAHQDSDAQGPPWLRDRKITAVVFVNGPEAKARDGGYRGGTLTLFRLNGQWTDDDPRTQVPAEPGLLVAFRASVFHEVSRITWGERYSIVTWFL